MRLPFQDDPTFPTNTVQFNQGLIKTLLFDGAPDTATRSSPCPTGSLTGLAVRVLIAPLRAHTVVGTHAPNSILCTPPGGAKSSVYYWEVVFTLLYAVGPATCLVLQAVCTLTEAAFLIALARESGGRLTVDTR